MVPAEDGKDEVDSKLRTGCEDIPGEETSVVGELEELIGDDEIGPNAICGVEDELRRDSALDVDKELELLFV